MNFRPCDFFIYFPSAYFSPIFYLIIFIHILFTCFTQIRDNITYLYAYVHNYIYRLLHTTISRHTSERTTEINKEQRTSKTKFGNPNDVTHYN